MDALFPFQSNRIKNNFVVMLSSKQTYLSRCFSWLLILEKGRKNVITRADVNDMEYWNIDGLSISQLTWHSREC